MKPVQVEQLTVVVRRAVPLRTDDLTVEARAEVAVDVEGVLMHCKAGGEVIRWENE